MRNKILALCAILVTILVGLQSQTAANASEYFVESVPVYMLHLGGRPGQWVDCLMTTNHDEKENAINNGWTPARVLAFWISPAQIPGTVPLYRLYSPSLTDHFYVSTLAERDSAIRLGFSQEGIIGYVFPKNSAQPGTWPLHRYYHGGESTYHEYHLNPNADGYEGIECRVWSSKQKLVSLHFTAPKYYEELKGLSEQSITWVSSMSNSSVKGGYVSLYFSADSGKNWTQITSGIINTGIAKWKVPNIDTQTGKLRIVWTDNLIGTSNLLARVESPDFKIKRTGIIPLSKPKTAVTR